MASLHSPSWSMGKTPFSGGRTCTRLAPNASTMFVPGIHVKKKKKKKTETKTSGQSLDQNNNNNNLAMD
jgi:hypothetical protein